MVRYSNKTNDVFGFGHHDDETRKLRTIEAFRGFISVESASPVRDAVCIGSRKKLIKVKPKMQLYDRNEFANLYKSSQSIRKKTLCSIFNKQIWFLQNKKIDSLTTVVTSIIIVETVCATSMLIKKQQHCYCYYCYFFFFFLT